MVLREVFWEASLKQRHLRERGLSLGRHRVAASVGIKRSISEKILQFPLPEDQS